MARPAEGDGVSLTSRPELKASLSPPNPEMLERPIVGGSATNLEWLLNEVRSH
jgi:hypothetical protein